MSQAEQTFNAALPYLTGKTVTDLVVGISMIGVELDHNRIGVAYVLRDALPGGCSVFPYARGAIGQPADKIAHWIVDGQDDVQRAIGNAVLNAASQDQSLVDCDDPDHPFGLSVTASDTVGMIGMIHPAVMMLKPTGCRFIIFDQGQAPDGDPSRSIYPMHEQAQLLPQCDVVFLSGTTTINGSIDSLMELCANTREIVLLGTSAPMYPDAFKGTKITLLAGSWWAHKDKDEIFRLISLASGMDALSRFMEKKNVRV